MVLKDPIIMPDASKKRKEFIITKYDICQARH